MILVAEKLHQCGLLATFSSSSPHQTLATGHFLFSSIQHSVKIKLLLQGYTIRILLWTFVQSFKVSLANRHTNIDPDRKIHSISGAAIRLLADCHAVFHLRHHRNAGIGKISLMIALLTT